MLAQRLRHSVAIQAHATSIDSYGGNVGSWSTVATVRAAIEPVSGTEARRDGQTAAEQVVRVVMRYRSDLTEQHRLLWGSVVYNIKSLACRDEARRWLELTCTRGTP